jgi:hypothetical protein
LCSRLGKEQDWVVLYFHSDGGGEAPRTIVTETRGASPDGALCAVANADVSIRMRMREKAANTNGCHQLIERNVVQLPE